MSSADSADLYEQQSHNVAGDGPAGDRMDNDYTSRSGQKNSTVPVQEDTDAVEDPIDPATADSDETLSTLHLFSPLPLITRCWELRSDSVHRWH